MNQKRSIKLLVILGKLKGKYIDISTNEEKFLIGRSPDCHLRSPNPMISRVHASITQEKGQVFIEDEGSANGTYVNNEKLKQGKVVGVSDGDLIQVGPLHFVVVGASLSFQHQSEVKNSELKIYNEDIKNNKNIDAVIEEVLNVDLEAESESDYEVSELKTYTQEPKIEGEARKEVSFTINYKCPKCKNSGKIPVAQLGKLISCKCGAELFVGSNGEVIQKQAKAKPKSKEHYKVKMPGRRTGIGIAASLVIFSLLIPLRYLNLGQPALVSKTHYLVEAISLKDNKKVEDFADPKTKNDALQWMNLINPVLKQNNIDNASSNINVQIISEADNKAVIMVDLNGALTLTLYWIKDKNNNWLLEGQQTFQFYKNYQKNAKLTEFYGADAPI